MLMLLAACGSDAAFDPFAQAPPCDSRSGDGRLDLDTACADGACAEGTLSDWVAALGEADECEASYDDSVRCDWDAGIRGYFDDEDEDGEVDPDSEAGIVFLDEPYDGTTADGLGLGVSTACFADALGTAAGVSLEWRSDGYAVTDAHWDSPELEVEDSEGSAGEDVPDGLVDELSLWGA